MQDQADYSVETMYQWTYTAVITLNKEPNIQCNELISNFIKCKPADTAQ